MFHVNLLVFYFLDLSVVCIWIRTLSWASWIGLLIKWYFMVQLIFVFSNDQEANKGGLWGVYGCWNLGKRPKKMGPFYIKHLSWFCIFWYICLWVTSYCSLWTNGKVKGKVGLILWVLKITSHWNLFCKLLNFLYFILLVFSVLPFVALSWLTNWCSSFYFWKVANFVKL